MGANAALNGGDLRAALNGAYGQWQAADKNAKNVMAQEDAELKPLVQQSAQLISSPKPTVPEPVKAKPAPFFMWPCATITESPTSGYALAAISKIHTPESFLSPAKKLSSI